MIFSFEETPESRASSSDTASSTKTLVFKAVGEQNEAIVEAYAYSATPGVVTVNSGTIYRKSISIDPDGWAQYIVTVTYGKLDSSSVAVGSSTFSFDTSGATINIKAAKAHVASYPDSGNWHKGAINVKADGDVEGVEIVIPALKLTYAFNHPEGVVTENFARLIASVTGMTNNGTFRGFAAGELLFAGASGSDGSDAEATVSYSFVASSNVTDLSISDITGIAKSGHDYAWVEFEDDVDTGEAIRPPKRVHVERVYDSFNFASVFGWS